MMAEGASFKSFTKAIVQGGDDFRPVGIAIAPDGSLYISDWVDKSYNVHGRGRIWRISTKAPAKGVGKDRAISRGMPPVMPKTDALAKELLQNDVATDRERLLGAVFLARQKKLEATTVRELATRGASENLLAAAVRLYADSRPEERKSSLADLLRYDIFRSHPRAKMEAMVRTENVFGLESEFLEIGSKNSDPFLRSAALQAIARSATREVIEGFTKSEDEDHRLFALLVLRRKGGCGKVVSPFAVEKVTPVDPSIVAKFLRDPSPKVRRAALQWVGDEKLKDLEKTADESLDRGFVTREVFDAYLAAKGLLGGQNPDQRGRKSRDSFLAQLALNGRRPDSLRSLALRAVSPGHEWTSRDFEVFVGQTDPQFRRTALRVLSDSASSAAKPTLLKAARDGDLPESLRRQAIVGLSKYAASDDESRRALIGFLQGFVSGEKKTLGREAARSLRGVELDARNSVKRSKVDGTLLGELDAKTLEDDEALLQGGDAAEGELVFFHPSGPRCSSCHTVGARGGTVGPELSTAGRLGRKKLLASIVDPSREVAPQFATWTYLTLSGAKVGISLGEAPDGALKVGLADGLVDKIPRDQFVERRANAESLMPTNLHASMTKAELRDLLAYLESLR
jgi:putative heme-binding domain-containing protein